MARGPVEGLEGNSEQSFLTLGGPCLMRTKAGGTGCSCFSLCEMGLVMPNLSRLSSAIMSHCILFDVRALLYPTP